MAVIRKPRDLARGSIVRKIMSDTTLALRRRTACGSLILLIVEPGKALPTRRIVGWRVSRSPNTRLVLDALEQAIAARQPGQGLIQHTDQGVQYLSIRYSNRLDDVDIQPSVGRVGSAYDNALAETINGLFKVEVLRQRNHWDRAEDIGLATLNWVHWFNHPSV